MISPVSNDAVWRVGLLIASAALVSCREAPVGPVCTPTVGEAISVVARDARSGEPLPAAGSRGVVTDGAFTDSLRPSGLETPVVRTLYGGGDRAGTYTVTLERDGYGRWERSGVVVTRGVCGVNTVGVVADLEPLS